MQKMWTVLRKDGPDHLGLWTTNASGGSNRREDCRCGRPAGGEQGVPRRPSQLCSSSRSRSCAPGARHAHNVLGAPLTHRLTVVTAVQATIISNVTSATNAARAGGTSPEGQLRLSLSVSLSLSLSLSVPLSGSLPGSRSPSGSPLTQCHRPGFELLFTIMPSGSADWAAQSAVNPFPSKPRCDLMHQREGEKVDGCVG